MQSGVTSENKKLKYSILSCKMPQSDADLVDGQIPFPIEKIVQYPIPGYGAPTSVNFSPDDNLISYLFSPDNTLNRKVFVFDLTTCKQELFFSPPDGGLDEDNLSEEEKFRRERLRERGLGVTQYEWVKTSSKRTTIMVPLPAGVRITFCNKMNKLCHDLCSILFILLFNCLRRYISWISLYNRSLSFPAVPPQLLIHIFLLMVLCSLM